MYKTDKVQINDIAYVLDNLSELTKDEIVYAFGIDFKNEILPKVYLAKESWLIKLKETDETVGVFGLIEETKDIAGVFFLTTKNLNKGNMIKLLRHAREVVEEWNKKYQLLLDDCFVENEKIVKWLHSLGFKAYPAEETGSFKTFYKGNLQVWEKR